jgi:hypothetical protein
MAERVVRHCLCGATLTARSTPARMALDVAKLFDRVHIGDGHGPASRQQAADARRRGERQARREEAGHA